MASIDFKGLGDLLKACKSAGVVELKISDTGVEVKFGSDQRTKKTPASEIAIPSDQEMNLAVKEALDSKTQFDADEELAHMQVDNPALYEELIVQRELQEIGKPREQREREQAAFDQ